MAIVVEKLVNALGFEFDPSGLKKYKDGLAEARKAARDVRDELGGVGRASDKMGSAGGKGFRAASAGAMGFLGKLFLIKETIGRVIGSLVDGAKSFITEMVQANVQFEDLMARLKTVLGSDALAKEKFGELQKFAKETPFQLQEVISAYADLKGAGFDASDANMRALGDLATASGKDFKLVVEALSSAKRGLGSMVDNFTAAGIAAKAVKGKLELITREGQKKLIDPRNTKELMKFFVEAGKIEGVGGAMGDKMQTLGGKISNLKDNMFQFFIAIGDAGVRDALRDLLGLFVDGVGDTGNLAKGIGHVLTKAIRMATGAIKTLVAQWEGAKKVAVAVAAVASPLVTMGLVLEDLYVFLQGGDSLLGRFFARIRNESGEVGAAIRRIINFFLNLRQGFQDLKALFTGGEVSPGMERIKTMASKLFGIFQSEGPSAFNTLKEIASSVLDTLAQRFNQLSPLISRVLGIIGTVAGPIFKLLAAQAVPVLKLLMLNVGVLGKYFATVFGGIFDIVVVVLDGIVTAMEFVAKVWAGIIEEMILPVVEKLSSALSGVIGEVASVAGLDLGFVDGIKDAVSPAKKAGPSGPVLAATSGAGPGGGAKGIGTQNNTATISTTVQITTNDPERAGKAVAGAVEGAGGRAAKSLSRGSGGGVS